MRRKSLGLNAFLNGLNGILSLLFPLVTFPYVSRILGVKGLGIYNYSNSIVSYFVLIAGLGIGSYAIREGAKYRDNPSKMEKFSNEIFTINMYSTIIAYCLLFFSLIIFKPLQRDLSSVLIFSIQILFTTLGVNWLYSIYEDYTYITLRSIAFNILSLILIFIFVKNRDDYLYYVCITVFSIVGSNSINFLHARKIVKIKLIKTTNWKYHLSPILIIFASSIAITIYMNSDITLLGLMKNNYIVGIYSVSAKIYNIVKTLLSSALIVTVPRLATLFGKRKLKEYKETLEQVINNMVIIVLPTMVGIIMLSKEIIIIISGEKFVRATSSLKILSIAIIFSFFTWLLTDCVLLPAKREKKVLFGTLIGALVNIILNLLLIPRFNENAAAFSTILAEFTSMIFNIYYSKDISASIFLSKKFRMNFESVIVGCGGIVFICILCSIGIKSLILRTLISVLLSIVIYIAILILLENKIINLYLHIIYSKIKLLKNSNI